MKRTLTLFVLTSLSWLCLYSSAFSQDPKKVLAFMRDRYGITENDYSNVLEYGKRINILNPIALDAIGEVFILGSNLEILEKRKFLPTDTIIIWKDVPVLLYSNSRLVRIYSERFGNKFYTTDTWWWKWISNYIDWDIATEPLAFKKCMFDTTDTFLFSGQILSSDDLFPISGTEIDFLGSKCQYFAFSDSLGNFSVFLPKENFSVRVKKEGFLEVFDSISTSKIFLEQNYKFFFLKKMEILDDFVLRRVEFEFDSTRIKNGVDSANLARFGEFMVSLKKYPGLGISVMGHTDSKGSDPYNDALSQKREEVVCNYFLKQGAPISNLDCKGFGKRQPRTGNETDEGRAVNRRVEFQLFQK